MVNVTRSFFIGLSNNRLLNNSAKRWGFRLGANKFIAGTDLDGVVEVIRDLNASGISCTLDHLGEFVSNEAEAIQAKDHILATLDRIQQEKLDCHLSVKLTQLGLDIGVEFCKEHMLEILEKAHQYAVFVNIDMEDYAHYQQTLDILGNLRCHYENIGTVIQSYLYRSREDMKNLNDVRLRIVKGAYKESDKVAFQNKRQIDKEFLLLAKERLLDGVYTSIATHDHHIIYELIDFIKENEIPKETFEFQMLFGFRTELQSELVREGYHVCTYIPFGTDWFGYFMRRLAERPQNLQLLWKDKIYTSHYSMKKKSIYAGAITALLWIRWRRNKRKKEK